MARSERPEPANGKLDELSVQAVRTVALDAAHETGCGDPGACIALAPAACALWTRFLRFSPLQPDWFDRDRVVLACRGAAPLWYALLRLSGCDVTPEQLRRSCEPGAAPTALLPGVELTGGHHGQGLMLAAGMAAAEAHLAALFNRPGCAPVNHRCHVLCGPAELAAGGAVEAAVMAGRLGLGKLICVCEGGIDADDVTAADLGRAARELELCGWHVQSLGTAAGNPAALAAALSRAGDVVERPSLIVGRSCGVLLDEGGAPFAVPARVRRHLAGIVAAGAEQERRWRDGLSAFRNDSPVAAAQFDQCLAGAMSEGWDRGLPRFSGGDGPVSTWAAATRVLAQIEAGTPALITLSSSQAAVAIGPEGELSANNPAGRHLRCGRQEQAMCAAAGGLARHGGLRPVVALSLAATDGARPALRRAALQGLPVIYLAADAGNGADGGLMIEQLAALRAVPGLCVIRPGDAAEVTQAWRLACARRGPTLLVLTPHRLAVFDRDKLAPADGVGRGAYILSPAEGADPDLILIASGAELPLAVAAQGALATRHGVNAEVVSMPSWELFRGQPQSYRDTVLPPRVRTRLALEAGSPLGWCEWVGDEGAVISGEALRAVMEAGEAGGQPALAAVERVVERAQRMMSP